MPTCSNCQKTGVVTAARDCYIMGKLTLGVHFCTTCYTAFLIGEKTGQQKPPVQQRLPL